MIGLLVGTGNSGQGGSIIGTAGTTTALGAQGGDVTFLKYIDAVYAVTPGENNLDLAELPIIAKNIGLNVDTFNQCLSSGKYTKKVQDSYNEAIALGAQGTPYSLVMVGTEAVTLNGNQPYDSMRAAIDAVLGDTPLAPAGAASTTTR